jgi:hypothetical protein
MYRLGNNIFAISIGLLLTAATAAAEESDCPSDLSMETKNVVSTLINCVKALQKENAELRTAIEDRERDDFEGQFAPLMDRLLHGAVLAFNRSEDQSSGIVLAERGACPPGWSLFKPAGGRMIVGAGQHEYADLSSYPSFADNPNTALGGVEKHALKPEELPSHNHGIKDAMDGENVGWDKNPPSEWPIATATTGSGITEHYTKIFTEGENRPHDNMPPYIALYFCMYDGAS